MARENNIDLSQVKGTGAGGRITKQDVEALPGAQAQPPPAAAAAPRPPPPPPAAAPAPAPPPPSRRCRRAGQAKTRIEPMSTMRRRSPSTW